MTALQYLADKESFALCLAPLPHCRSSPEALAGPPRPPPAFAAALRPNNGGIVDEPKPHIRPLIPAHDDLQFLDEGEPRVAAAPGGLGFGYHAPPEPKPVVRAAPALPGFLEEAKTVAVLWAAVAAAVPEEAKPRVLPLGARPPGGPGAAARAAPAPHPAAEGRGHLEEEAKPWALRGALGFFGARQAAADDDETKPRILRPPPAAAKGAAEEPKPVLRLPPQPAQMVAAGAFVEPAAAAAAALLTLPLKEEAKPRVAPELAPPEPAAPPQPALAEAEPPAPPLQQPPMAEAKPLLRPLPLEAEPRLTPAAPPAPPSRPAPGPARAAPAGPAPRPLSPGPPYLGMEGPEAGPELGMRAQWIFEGGPYGDAGDAMYDNGAAGTDVAAEVAPAEEGSPQPPLPGSAAAAATRADPHPPARDPVPYPREEEQERGQKRQRESGAAAAAAPQFEPPRAMRMEGLGPAAQGGAVDSTPNRQRPALPHRDRQQEAAAEARTPRQTPAAALRERPGSGPAGGVSGGSNGLWKGDRRKNPPAGQQHGGPLAAAAARAAAAGDGRGAAGAEGFGEARQVAAGPGAGLTFAEFQRREASGVGKVKGRGAGNPNRPRR